MGAANFASATYQLETRGAAVLLSYRFEQALGSSVKVIPPSALLPFFAASQPTPDFWTFTEFNVLPAGCHDRSRALPQCGQGFQANKTSKWLTVQGVAAHKVW